MPPRGPFSWIGWLSYARSRCDFPAGRGERCQERFLAHAEGRDRRGERGGLRHGLAALALTYPPRPGVIGRWRGGILPMVYVAYLAAVLQAQ